MSEVATIDMSQVVTLKLEYSNYLRFPDRLRSPVQCNTTDTV